MTTFRGGRFFPPKGAQSFKSGTWDEGVPPPCEAFLHDQPPPPPSGPCHGASSGDAIQFDVVQVAHGFAVGMPIARGPVQWTQADRDDASRVADAVVASVTDADSFTAVKVGLIVLTPEEWAARSGYVGGLVAGEFYWLSSTSGGITQVMPDNGLKQIVLKAITSTVALVDIGDVFGGLYVPPVPVFEHVQSTPSTNWVVNHNFGFYPVCAVRTTGGVEMDANIQHLSTNVLVIQLNTPLAGSARLT